MITETSIDANTAQEALALAIRLQQETGERVTMDELRRTAIEAGIDAKYLEGALKQVAGKAPTSAERFVPQKHIVTIAVLAVFSLLTMVTWNWAHHWGEWTEGGLMVIVAAAIGVRILALVNATGPATRPKI